MKTINVVVLDDSLFVREAMQQELERDVNIRVVGKAADAYEARDLIVEHVPDVLIADVNLGGMSGTEFVQALLPQHYLPVIMISSDASARGKALAANAVDFIPKPSASDARGTAAFYQQILVAIKAAANGTKQSLAMDSWGDFCIAIGASTGGAEVLAAMFKDMPAIMPPIVVAQHMPANFTKSFAERVNQASPLSVKEAVDGDILVPGQVYIAPGGRNMSVKPLKARFAISVKDTADDKKATPNIDTLFFSVAQCYRGNAIGALLTGMGRDGAEGLKAMHDNGAFTFAQDEESSVVYGMPRVAKEIGAVDYQCSPSEIRQKCIEMVRKMEPVHKRQKPGKPGR